MFYTKEIRLKQNDFYYIQVDGQGNLKATQPESNEYREDDIDTTEYIYNGQLGCFVKSFEKKEPRAGSVRVVYGIEVIPSKVKKISKSLFNKEYEIWWVLKRDNSIDNLDKIFKEIMS